MTGRIEETGMSLREAAEALQSDLALIDWASRPPSRFPEFLVAHAQSLQIKVKMYGEDGPHKRPHVHIDYGRQHHTASYAIDDGSRIAGELDRKYDRVIADWISQYKDDLNAAWKQTQSGRKPEEIIAKLKGTLG